MSEALLTRARCEEIFGLIAAAALSEGVADVEAMLAVGVNALTRFANNTIHQNVSERGGHISVRALIDGRTARASSNRFDADSIRRVTSEAIAITRLQAPDADVLSLPAAGSITTVDRFVEATATATPDDRARAVKDAIDVVESESLTAAGIYSTNQSALAIINSRGLFDYHEETMAQFHAFLLKEGLTFNEAEYTENVDWTKRLLRREMYVTAFSADEARRIDVESDPIIGKAVESMPKAKALLETAKKTLAQRLSK